MKSSIRNLFRAFLPTPFKKWLKEIILAQKIRQVPAKHKKALKKIRKKEKIKVAFFLIHEAVWKYKGVYNLMENDPRFDPIVLICPYTSSGEENMHGEMKSAYKSFKKKGYNVIKTYDEKNGNWLDVKKEINPDIVFFTNPHYLTKKEYYILNYLDTLTCYAPYAFVVIHLLSMHYNIKFHGLLWKHFVETEIHKGFSNQIINSKRNNVIVTGYPALDDIYNNNFTPNDKWKIKNPTIKRIIWAPHHTIDDDKSLLSYSNFLEYAWVILDLTKKFKSGIQIAFKPHPMLRSKLFENVNWGKEKTEKYYNTWAELPNGQLEEGDYLDLFATSDAMILDSASFMVEYLYTGNPSIFTVRDENITDRFNEFGKTIFHQLYKGRSEGDITDFIVNVVIKHEDTMKTRREAFFKDVVLPPHGNTASENIFNDILKSIT